MASSAQAEDVEATALETVPLRRPWRLVGAVVIAILVAQTIQVLLTNSRFQWDIVWQYLTFPRILEGLGRTIFLTAGAMLIGIVGGTLLAVMRLSANPMVSWSAWAYVFLFRGTPVLVQLLFWFNLSALFPSIGIGIPLIGPTFFQFNANDVITVYVAALLGLGLNEAAYMSEIVRAGINSVDRGQTDAAHALGMGNWDMFRRVIMPQAMRVIVPPTANNVIGMLKTTALVSVIALPDLLYSAQLIYNRDFDTIPLLIVACIWYLVLTTILSICQFLIERRFNRGSFRRGAGETTAKFLMGPGAVSVVPAVGEESQR